MTACSTSKTPPPPRTSGSPNPASLESSRGFVEPSVRGAAPGSRFQLERIGYFCADPDTTAEQPVFNRTVALKDTWEKVKKSTQAPARDQPGTNRA